MRKGDAPLLRGMRPLFLLCCFFWNAIAAEAPPPPQRIIAYVAGWSMPERIPADQLTHINFAFARIDGEGRVAFENPDFAGALKSLVALKRQNPRLKVIVSVGGWEADGFSDAALTDSSREAFA